MTVKDLITKLQEQQQDLTVVFDLGTGEFSKIDVWAGLDHNLKSVIVISHTNEKH